MLSSERSTRRSVRASQCKTSRSPGVSVKVQGEAAPWSRTPWIRSTNRAHLWLPGAGEKPSPGNERGSPAAAGPANRHIRWPRGANAPVLGPWT